MAQRGVNKAILIGNIGKDPEVEYFPNGDAFCNLTLATSETWTDKSSGEKKERTEWHNIVFMRKLAEVVGQYVRKGSKLYVEGSLRTRKWQDKDGSDRYTTEILVGEMQMMDGKPSDGSGQRSGPPAGRTAQSGARPGGSAAPVDFEDDDIPF